MSPNILGGVVPACRREPRSLVTIIYAAQVPRQIGPQPRADRPQRDAYPPSVTDHADIIRAEFAEAARLAALLAGDPDAAEKVAKVAELIAERVKRGGKVLAVGNGGSCADAVHFCEELTGRYQGDRPSIGAVACSDAGHITCTGNDYGFDSIFSRWIEGLARPGDVLIALSTSGKSANIVQAVRAAREKDLLVILLLGKDGGQLAQSGDHTWIVPGSTTDRIQELHMLILHSLVGAIERSMGFA